MDNQVDSHFEILSENNKLKSDFELINFYIALANDIKIYLYNDEITQLDADAIVISSRFELRDVIKIKSSILKKSGNTVLLEAQYRQSHSLEKIMVTSSGDLPCKYLFHRSIDLIDPRPSEQYPSPSKLTLKCIEIANQLEIKSIAIPIFKTSNLGLTFLETAIQIIKVIEETAKDDFNTIKIFYLYFSSQKQYQELIDNKNILVNYSGKPAVDYSRINYNVKIENLNLIIKDENGVVIINDEVLERSENFIFDNSSYIRLEKCIIDKYIFVAIHINGVDSEYTAIYNLETKKLVYLFSYEELNPNPRVIGISESKRYLALDTGTSAIGRGLTIFDLVNKQIIEETGYHRYSPTPSTPSYRWLPKNPNQDDELKWKNNTFTYYIEAKPGKKARSKLDPQMILLQKIKWKNGKKLKSKKYFASYTE